MTSTSLTITEVLEKLGNKSQNDTISILTFINSDAGRNALKTIGTTQYSALCKLLVGVVVNDGENAKQEDLSNIKEGAQQALHNLLNDSKKAIKFFEIILHIDRSKWLTVFQFLETLDDDVLLRISEDSNVLIYLNNSLQSVRVDVMKWLSPSVCIDNIDLLLEVEESSSKSTEDQLAICTLIFLEKIYKAAVTYSQFNIQKFHLLVFEKIIILTYMGHKRQRTYALKLINRAIRSDFEDFIREKHENVLAEYKTNLQNHYYIRMLSLVKAKQSDWCYLWCLSLEIVGTDLYRGAELINNLLMVEEKAFKSTDMTIRLQAFIAWKSLINIFASNPAHFIVPRRIKLLCTPLNAKNSKTEAIAVTKLQVWWHLIVKLYPYIEKYANQVIFQFLNFCFGPLGETPLLSTKCDLASPGKRFLKARIYAVDALLQLLVVDEKERREVSLVLDQQVSNAVTNIIFQENYKCFIHSVGEAVLIISDLETQSEEYRIKLNRVLWLNLLNYIQQCNTDQKMNMFKELILVIGEITNHLEDSSLISNLLLNVILPELIKISACLTHRDTNEFLIKLLSHKLLMKVDKKHWNNIKNIMCHGIKPDNVTTYNPNSLELLKALINQIQLAVESKANNDLVVELWCALSESMTKYIADNQEINEGTSVAHNFETLLFLIYFPVKNICWSHSEQMLKMIRIWKDLYKEFNLQADLIATVKFNEILNIVTETMKNYITEDTKRYTFVAHCLSTLMSTIHYDELLKEETIPPIIILLQDITKIALSNMNNVTELECTLKALSSLLITVFGLNHDKVILYLCSVSSAVESMLKVEATGSIEREIFNTWETIVLICRNLTNLLTYDFLTLYQEAIISSMCHVKKEIVNETLTLFSDSTHFDEKSKDILDGMASEATKLMGTKRTACKLKTEVFSKTPKQIKLIGSFIGRKIQSPKTLSSKKDKGKKLQPPPPEPDSQEYVIINSDVKVNVNLLTEHQKECFKQHKDDIPAMYNELSQSGSCNTQQLEEWFKDKAANNNLQTANDADKENKNDVTADVCADNISKLNHIPKVEPDAERINSFNSVQVVDKKPSAEELSPLNIDGDKDKYDDDQVSGPIAKKLNFESHEEFPEEADKSNDTKHSMQDAIKCRGRMVNSVYSRANRNKSDDSLEFDNSESSQVIRSRVRTRSSKSNVKVSAEIDNLVKGIKRKSADADSDEDLLNKRRRYTVIPSSVEVINESRNIKTGNTLDGIGNSVTDPNLPERTKKEISRLKIDMVFDSKMTSKLRSKPNDDYIYDTTVKRHSMDSKSARQKIIKSEKDNVQNEQSQELLRRRRRRESKTTPEIKSEFTGFPENENNTSNISKSSEESEYNDKESDRSTTEKEDDDKKLTDELKNSFEITSVPIATSTCKQSATQEDEVIESSQESCSIRGSLKKNDKKLAVINDKNDVSQSPSTKKDLQNSSLGISIKSSPSPNNELHNSKEPTVDVSTINSSETKKLATIFTYSSPKSKRKSKIKGYTPQGRAAHMLDLVTKHAIVEKKSVKNGTEEDEEKNEQATSNEINANKEVEPLAVKKDYIAILSPVGHRQEKIFNNMRSADNSSPPSKLFSNLKNDGEKISPKMEKFAKESNKLNDHDYTEIKDVDNNVSFDKEELPLLEWSNANPPSLTASPSVSILKRQRQSFLEVETTETTPKRKRVSFADPPVSKQMGYQIVSEMSPSKSKLGSSLSFPGRKGTPYRIQQSRSRTIEIPADKLATLSNKNENDVQNQKDNESFINISVNIQDQCKEIEESIINPMEIDFNIPETPIPEVHVPLPPIEHEQKIDDDAANVQQEISIEETETQNDVFHEDEHSIEAENMTMDTSDTKDKNDSTITRIINENGSISDEHSETLEDTVDIQNISNITANSDELCENKPIRTVSQVAAINAFAECDTLPLSDSMFSSHGSIQNSQGNNKSVRNKSIKSKDVIYHELSDCEEPIESIINILVNPLWMKNLSKYFKTKNINTIGDLARLTEQEAAQIPIYRTSKVSYIKKVLEQFSKSSHKLLVDENVKTKLKIEYPFKVPGILNDSTEISSLTPSVEPSDNLNISEALTNQQTSQDKDSEPYGSMILDTSISPPKKTSTVLIKQIQESPVPKVSIAVSTDASLITSTQSVQVEAKLEELLDELDGDLVLKTAIRRSSLQNVLREYTGTTNGTSNENFQQEVLNILGINSESSLKIACRDYGLIQILRKLPDIFNNDKQYFLKVLKAYRTKITAKDCLSAFSKDEIKDELCNGCNSTEISDMMLKVLENEEARGIKSAIKNTFILNAMLKRMSIESFINNTIANNELISSSVILDIGLRNNSSDIILQALEKHSPDVRQKVLENSLTPSYLVSHIKDTKMSKEQLSEIYKAISDKFTTEEFIDLNAEILKQKIQMHSLAGHK